ncbi:MAG: hemerythrin domain-containing protein [Rhodospirillaceae bacterium]
MSKTVDVLRRDHANFGLALNALEHQSDLAAHGIQPNVRLLKEIIVYLEGYPFECHLPVERLICEQLIRRFPQLAGDLVALAEDRQAMAEPLRLLKAEVDCLDFDCTESRARFRQEIENVLVNWRRHLKFRDELLLQRAENCMAPHQWAEIELVLRRHADPVFGIPLSALGRQLSGPSPLPLPGTAARGISARWS